jgi:hypothetical protein
MKVTIEIKGDKKIQSKLKRLGESLFDLRGAFDDIGDQAIKYYSGQGFSSMGGVFGESWPRLAQSTMRQKLKTFPQFSNVPLMATGKMKESFTAKVSKDSVKITNTAPYFVYHQSSAPRHHLPRRAMMGINDPIRMIIEKSIKAEIMKKLKA